MSRTIDWDALDAHKYADEDHVVETLLARPALGAAQREQTQADAVALIEAVRASPAKGGVVESFLQQFSLGTAEGIALMCLAEALLRVPDAMTRDKLIAEKIGSADWAAHMGQSDSLFVNASTWGLMLTGKIVDVEPGARKDSGGYFRRLVTKLGEPVIREAVGAAVGIMSEQFVLGKTIEAALRRAKREDTLCSFDMLGEGARTVLDAERYERIYADAIDAVGKAANGAGPEAGHGISVKLSALSPRFEAVQEARVWAELYPRVLKLAEAAKGYDLNFTIDAEEADRTVLTLKLLDRLAQEPSLDRWQGLGVVIQAYQKRAPKVIATVADLARASGRRIMVRLVKGAYWDSEIKRAQIAGRPDYPVFTTKAATDVCYLASARALIAASPYLYAQFATHNAHTLSAVRAMATEANVAIEHQRLHGMGEALYDAATERFGPLRIRAYAPVGGHEELLPYLVRRLLENGANTSFVNQLLDERVPPAEVAPDPVTKLEARPKRHPNIPMPAKLYGPMRGNPVGRDFSIAAVRETQAKVARPGIATVADAGIAEIDAAISRARKAFPDWDAAGGAARGNVLRGVADALEAKMEPLVALLSAEAGKTLNDGVSEVREAIDFCRYYAVLAETHFAGATLLTGPTGETNELILSGRGVFACISPWNFPLAIFTGQIAAALAAGNAVIAKPAEQTPLIAAEAVRLFHEAGLETDLLALAPGNGATVGAALVAHPGIDGVAFTGGTETAWAINRSIANRDGPIIPFIAETGGLNGMFIDTTALREQVVDDVMLSAFGSAGQRCSALRILFLPHESADEIIETIRGAMDVLNIGNPSLPETDIGPVIDAEARAALEAHVAKLEREARVLHRCVVPLGGGHFCAPTLAEIASVAFLEREVFGPILHVIRYDQKDLETVAKSLAITRYGLTLGIHSRLDSFAREVQRLVPAGNVYVNRSMIGAVVGVQPFGGSGLSGTGPKAGGPHALLRYAIERAISVNITAKGGDPLLMAQAS
jgi:RHH-type transcriptional regulator, proline utilization regulon repressor / proline dehydrogenase / delta 1-pyrroline-5-carboxylate dehydrogenase